jgi:hypothetical protein
MVNIQGALLKRPKSTKGDKSAICAGLVQKGTWPFVAVHCTPYVCRVRYKKDRKTRNKAGKEFCPNFWQAW